MTDEELRIRVAELDASRHFCCRCDTPATLFKFGAFFCSEECSDRVSDYTLDNAQECVPDYVNDLNAMHDAWKREIRDKDNRDGDLVGRFNIELQEGVARDMKLPRNSPYVLDAFPNATARQRAEAFVATLTK